jgi:hypothetical protein
MGGPGWDLTPSERSINRLRVLLLRAFMIVPEFVQ